MGEILAIAKAISQEIIEIRRALHRRPELGNEERETAALVAAKLVQMGLEVRTGVAGTGVVAVLDSGCSGPVVALRADMDALPVIEETGLPFASEKPGLMHACGHDAHMAMVIGAARVLTEVKSALKGKVKFIFQPCEERPPGGAEAMIRAGVLEEPVVDAIFGLHVDPHLPVGLLVYKKGISMAGVQDFTLTVTGVSGHGASPQLTVDAVVVAAQLILALQTVVSRMSNPVDPVVLTVGMIEGGRANNIIADKVVLKGTIRALNLGTLNILASKIGQIASGVTAAAGAGYELQFTPGYPPLINDTRLLELVRQAVDEELGPGKVLRAAQPAMGSEDFAFFAQHVPGVFWHLGANSGGAEAPPWHHPRFDLDEKALPIGAAVLARCAVTCLEQWGKKK